MTDEGAGAVPATPELARIGLAFAAPSILIRPGRRSWHHLHGRATVPLTLLEGPGGAYLTSAHGVPRGAFGVQELRWDVLQKHRWRIVQLGSVDPTSDGATEEEPVLGARHTNIAQPPLLLQFRRFFERTAMGENPVFHARDEHHREFQPLR